MNIFAIVILGALLLGYSLEVISFVLNLRAIRYELPGVLQDLYKPEEYKKSQDYVKLTTRFTLIHSTFTLLVLLAFWFLHGFNIFDQVVRSWNFVPIINGILYIGILLLAYEIINLPFGIYRTFVIEQRFGFNKTTRKIFISDLFKGLALSVLIGAPILAGVLALFQYSGSYAWLYCWIGVILISLIMQYVSPTWIMPLFNKFTPMEQGELKDAIIHYTNSVNFPVKNIYVMDGSRRSTRSNAFFTGFGKNKRIALFDTLIAKHTVGELVSILAHEVGHYKKKHIILGLVISIIHIGLLFFLLSVFIGSPGLYQAFFMDSESIYAGLLFFGLLYTPLEMVLSVVMQIVSRKNEYQADRFAVETTHNKGNFIDALKKLHATNLSNLTPHPFYVFLNYSHPTLLQRVQAVEHLSQKT